MQYKIDNLIWSVLKSEYVKQKKQVLKLKYIGIFAQADTNANNIFQFNTMTNCLIYTHDRATHEDIMKKMFNHCFFH